ncbi:MAG: pyridoxal 5'-phosphate synthase glutaminase subunit PdxT [Planctomycetota bacterium]
MTTGILALQGDYAEHRAALGRHSVPTRLVRRVADLEGLTALVLPGGESTTMLRLLDDEGLFEPLGELLRSGIPVLGTCAGLILLAERVENPRQRSYGVLPVTIVRNGYGRQLHSGTFPLAGASRDLPERMTGTFIRAPRITAVERGCEILARRGNDPVLVRKGAVLGACFHPELDPGHPVLSLFARISRGEPELGARSALPAS